MNRAWKTLKVLATRRLVVTFDKIDFTYNRLSYRRLANWLLAELSYTAGSTRAWAYPTHLQIEPSNTCNLRCPVCHVVTDDKPRGLLSLEDFQRVIDEVGEYLLFLHFWGWGEPFMNRDFLSMIRYAKDKGIQIITSTNGHFFENEKRADQLIDSGLDVLIFALDGVDRATYEKYRRRGDFDKAVAGLRRLVERKKERGSAVPRLNLRMLVTRDNEDQVPSMRDLAREIGVDVLTLKTVNSFDRESEGRKLIPENPAYRRFEYDSTGRPVQTANTCKKLWNHPTLYRDGEVVACDYFTGTELSLGNAFNGDRPGFRQVWFGEDFRSLRRRFLSSGRAELRCGDCSLNYAGVERCVSHAFHFQEETSSRAG
jgi:radical SAM protein with 4Fe4S-binding SPASM domain